MDLPAAMTLLRERKWIETRDGAETLYCLVPYISTDGGSAELDGSFSLEELEAIVAFMRSKE